MSGVALGDIKSINTEELLKVFPPLYPSTVSLKDGRFSTVTFREKELYFLVGEINKIGSVELLNCAKDCEIGGALMGDVGSIEELLQKITSGIEGDEDLSQIRLSQDTDVDVVQRGCCQRISSIFKRS